MLFDFKFINRFFFFYYIQASRESIASYYSDAGEGNYGKIPVTGEVLFGLDYNYKNNIFEIHVKQCRDLAVVDTKKKRSDPYVIQWYCV